MSSLQYMVMDMDMGGHGHGHASCDAHMYMSMSMSMSMYMYTSHCAPLFTAYANAVSADSLNSSLAAHCFFFGTCLLPNSFCPIALLISPNWYDSLPVKDETAFFVRSPNS